MYAMIMVTFTISKNPLAVSINLPYMDPSLVIIHYQIVIYIYIYVVQSYLVTIYNNPYQKKTYSQTTMLIVVNLVGGLNPSEKY